MTDDTTKRVIHRGPTKNEDSVGEYFKTLPFCLECKSPRTILYLEPFRKMTMRVCTNMHCWKFCKTNGLKTWKK